MEALFVPETRVGFWFQNEMTHEIVEIGFGANWFEAKKNTVKLEPARPLIRRPGSTG